MQTLVQQADRRHTAHACRGPLGWQRAVDTGHDVGRPASSLATTRDITFLILSFEGPDRYSHAGGLGSRVDGLSRELAACGYETHLFFIGDPHLEGHEIVDGGKPGAGRLHLHRWCQWISHYHPGGVYDGEEGKLRDWNRSLPPWLLGEIVAPRLASGGRVVIMAEEWQTAEVLVTLHQELCRRGWGERVHLLWNANNIFGFERIPWEGLKQAATITTVSRYMKHVMWRHGVDARAIPNGILDRWLCPVDGAARRRLARLLSGRLVLLKVARFDPDKRWAMAVDAVGLLKERGYRPLFLARGGVENHGHEVLARARERGLALADVHWEGSDIGGLEAALHRSLAADLLVLRGYLSEAQRRVLYRIADGVLANSGIEPFGLVGLEAMACGGIAYVGCTGEDYVTPGHDAIALQTDDPWEILYHTVRLHSRPERALELRRAARRSAMRYTWRAVIERILVPFVSELAAHGGGLEVVEAFGPSAVGAPHPLEASAAAG
ncbi:MAG: glycosyltransferase [Planctomycetota bacterium]